MPTIEIASINSTGLNLNQGEFDIAIIEQNKLGSHRGMFYELLKKEMKAYIAVRLQIPENKLTAKVVCDKMDETNVPNSTGVALEELMQKVEWYLYTPYQPNDERAAMYSKAHEVIQEMNAHFLKNA